MSDKQPPIIMVHDRWLDLDNVLSIGPIRAENYGSIVGGLSFAVTMHMLEKPLIVNVPFLEPTEMFFNGTKHQLKTTDGVTDYDTQAISSVLLAKAVGRDVTIEPEDFVGYIRVKGILDEFVEAWRRRKEQKRG